MNTLDDLKLYCLNITSATVVSLGWLEPVLSILLLLTTLGYTAHKWYLLKNKRDYYSLHRYKRRPRYKCRHYKKVAR